MRWRWDSRKSRMIDGIYGKIAIGWYIGLEEMLANYRVHER